MSTPKKFLITSALPYANGPLHFGHLAGVYIPADIYARFRKLQGHQVLHICGSDEHGVAIMQNAQKSGVPYQDYVNQWHQNHKSLFDSYGIHFDFFGQTSADYHKDETLRWFKRLYEKGLIESKPEQQLRCQDCHNYLPDRYVQGTCYVCGYEKARGDECPQCGTWIDAIKLIKPQCQFCGSHNVKTEEVTQYYLMLSKMEKPFKQWFATKKWWRKTVVPFVESLVEKEMVDRAITRDLDWGIDVPLSEAKGKKLYVWFDAPIGYVSNTKECLKKRGSSEDYLQDWWHNPEVEISHFIGKDNIIFHSLIFPIMAMGTDYILPPTVVPANQYVNLEGKQFSKSQGWYIDAEEAFSTFGQDALRYYLINLIPESQDSSFTWSGFEAKVNNELANNIGNLTSRCLKFFSKNWPEGISFEVFKDYWASDDFKMFLEGQKRVRDHLEKIEIKRAMEELMHLGQELNNQFSQAAPWSQIKVDKALAQKTISYTALGLIHLAGEFTPFLPNLATQILKNYPAVFLEHIDRIYQHDLSWMKDQLQEGLVISSEISMLVPKIDSQLIKTKEEELKSKELGQ